MLYNKEHVEQYEDTHLDDVMERVGLIHCRLISNIMKLVSVAYPL
jgi:hypothetical protein